MSGIYGNDIKILGPNRFYLIWCFSKKCFVLFSLYFSKILYIINLQIYGLKINSLIFSLENMHMVLMLGLSISLHIKLLRALLNLLDSQDDRK